MANARMEALLSRRSPTLGSGSIRVLTPQNTGISAIAKRNAANESEVMINKYNSGLISNEEMKSFLQGQMNSPYITQSDKTDIQAKLQDFDVLIQKDKLESTFKLAPENSLQKEQAATALAQFYTNRASTMVAGTPAHSQALENAGNWQATVTNIQQSVSKLQRSNYEDQMLQKVNQTPPNSSQRSQAMAEMYQKLASMAASQGDVAAQNDYLAKMEQAQTYAEQYGAAETQKQSLKDIKQFAADQDLAIAKLTDRTSEELKMKAEKAYAVAQKYADIGDQLNYTKYMTIGTQAEEKYNKKITSDKGTSASSSWDKEDYKLSNGMQLAQKFLKDGQTPDGKPYTPEDYQNDVGSLVQAKSMKIQERIQIIDELAASDPNQKIKYDGSTRRVADILEILRKEEENIQPQADAVKAGTFAIMEVAPSKFTKAGAFKTSGKSIPDYQVIDINSIPPGLKDIIVPDDQGIYHQAYFKEQEIPTEQFDPYDPTMRFDKATNKAYKQTGEKVVDLYQQDKSKVGQTQIVSPDQPVKSLETIQREAEQTYQDTAVKQQKEKETVKVPELVIPKTPIQKVQDVVQGGLEKVQQIPQIKQAIPQIQKTVKDINTNIVQPAVQKVQEVKQSLPPVIQKSPIQAVQQAFNPPTVSAPSNSGSMPITKVVNNVPSVKQYSPTTGFSYQPIAAPKPVAPAPQPTTLQKIGTTLTGAAGQTVNKLKSWLGW